MADTSSINFTTVGTTNIILPYGTQIISARCWAGGGRGADITYPTGTQGGGGGGGAYAEATAATLSSVNDRLWNAVLTAIVGTGGVDASINGGNTTLYVILKSGSETIVNLAIAEGGGGVANNSTIGGKGGTVLTGQGYTGGNGASGSGTYGGGGGGGAGSSAGGGNASAQTGGTAGAGGGGRGGNGKLSPTGNGTNGTAYGGGGGGSYRTTTGSVSGGDGAQGGASIVFVYPTNVLLAPIIDPGR